MKRRSKLPLLALFPVSVLTFVAAVPLVLGDQPVRWRASSAVPHLVVGDDSAASATPSKSTSTPASTSADGAGASATASPKSSSQVTVDKEWKPGMPQWGVQLYWEEKSGQSDAYIERKAEEKAAYLVGLRANSVSVSFPFYTGGISSTKISRGARTPSPQRLARVLKVFTEAGLRTTIRPLMDEKSLDPPAGWRGNIEPASRSAWFTSYGAFLKPYLEMAEESKVDTVVVGTELNSMEGDAGWDALVADAEKLYGGEVAYDANWDNYVNGHIDMPVGHLGVDAYFPVEVPDTASVDALADGWDTWLDKKTTGPLPKIVLAEAGIGAMDGAYQAPGDFYTRRAVNPTVQAHWYAAVCQVVQEREMSGVYWWSIYFDSDPNAAPDDKTASRLDFAGRPQSEKAIRACFSSDYKGPGTD